MDSALTSPEYEAALFNFLEARRDFDEVNVWFWNWRDEYRPQRIAAAAVLQTAQNELDVATAHRDQIMSNAKAAVGVWSAYGLQDARDTFWSWFQYGSDVAQRATWYDVIFSALSSDRDSSLLGLVFHMLCESLANGLRGWFVSVRSRSLGVPSCLCAGNFSFGFIMS